MPPRPTSGSPRRRRPHPAANARRIAAATSLVTALGLSGVLAVSGATMSSVSAAAPSQSAALTASGRSAVLSASSAVPAAPAAGAVTASHGS